jgi:hypothetical protein
MSETIAQAVADIAAIKDDLRRRLATHKAPFHLIDVAAASAAIERLTSADPEHWANVWSAAADPFEAKARESEAAGDVFGARDAFMNAYGLLHAARFPSPTHPSKWRAYLRSIENFRAAGRHFDPPLEVVSVPFEGHPGEGRAVTFYVRRKASATKRPVVIRWGGVDTWKEERHDYNEAMLDAGFASINIDMPGVGESPVVGCIDGERQFLPLLDWIATQPDLDSDRVVVVGMSYGGYWATKVAHHFSERIVGAVNWGGGIDRFFSREWCLESAAAKSYLMDIGIARARTAGLTTYEEYMDFAPTLSLVSQGLLDRPHAPMFVLNGRHDEQVPFDDMIVLLEHGEPKEARFFPGGHMGYGPDTFPTVMRWLKKKAGITDTRDTTTV